MSDLAETMLSSGAVLAEGAVIERLRRQGALPAGDLPLAALVFDDGGRAALREIYLSYLEVAADTGLPIVILAPTWKADAERCGRAGLDIGEVSRASVEFMRETAAQYPVLAGRVFVGGLVGSRGDAYRPDEGLPRGTARRFHAPQIEALAEAAPDFMIASTIPSVEEAAGIAMAAAETGAPYVISYVARADGRVLDGTWLAEAVERVDGLGCAPPLFHMANCIHPANLARALGRDDNAPLVDSGRLAGLQGNASLLEPHELDGRPEIDADDPVRWAGAMAALYGGFGIRLLGGCCGTDERFIRKLAEFLEQV